ncbi:MAG: TonB-dependent receptor [Bacteroidales bacterium]|nr:TonB-dependent receptor [Bacteroidales bacterium]
MRKTIFWILAFLFILTSGIDAQILNDTINLEGIEIHGANERNRISITKEAMDNTGIPDAGIMLRNIPGLNGIKKGGASIDPMIRGFRFSQLNVMADDGMKVEGGCPNRMDPVASHIETDDIESIEVIKGPYALKYGPSFGGIIQLKTFTPKPYEHFEVHGRLHTSLNSNPMGANQYLLVHGGGQKVYFGISGSYKTYGNYKDADGNEVQSSFTKFNYSADIGFRPVKNHELLVSMHKNYGRDIRFPALPMDEIEDNTTLLSMDYHIIRPNKALGKLDFKLYNSDVYHEMDNQFRPAYSSIVPPYSGLMQAVATVNASNTGGRMELNYVQGKHEINSGFDLELAKKDGGRLTKMIMMMNGFETISKKNTNLWKESHSLNTGWFGDYILHLSNYQIQASARVDMNSAGSADTLKLIKEGVAYFDDLNSSFVNFSMNAGITRFLKGGHSLAIHFGRGVRSPDLTERYIKFLVVGYDNYDYLGNPQLKPEVNYQSDLILQLNLDKIGKLNLDLYASLVENYISGVILPSSVATPKSMGAIGVKQFNNTGQARFFGFETTYQSPGFNGFSAIISGAFTYGIHAATVRNLFDGTQVIGTEAVENDAIQEIPPFEAKLNINYLFFKERMSATIGTRLVAAQNHVSLAYYEKETPGFVILNANYNYVINKIFKVNLGVQNLLNQQYYEHLNRRIVGSSNKLTEPGRSVYMNLVITI